MHISLKKKENLNLCGKYYSDNLRTETSFNTICIKVFMCHLIVSCHKSERIGIVWLQGKSWNISQNKQKLHSIHVDVYNMKDY